MYTVYAEYKKEGIDYEMKGLTLEEAKNWYRDAASTFYKKAGTTWTNNVAFFENDENDEWRFNGTDDDGIEFHGGFYYEE